MKKGKETVKRKRKEKKFVLEFFDMQGSQSWREGLKVVCPCRVLLPKNTDRVVSEA